jgi:hypothetical protein
VPDDEVMDAGWQIIVWIPPIIGFIPPILYVYFPRQIFTRHFWTVRCRDPRIVLMALAAPSPDGDGAAGGGEGQVHADPVQGEVRPLQRYVNPPLPPPTPRHHRPHMI